MFERNIKSIIAYMVLIILAFNIFQCSTNVENSPDPGIVRVTIQSNPDDTFITIIGDTFQVSDADTFKVNFFQGKIYNNEKYALLYTDIKSYTTEEVAFNVFEREDNTYKKFVIYESYALPQSYNRLQIGIKEYRIPGHSNGKITISRNDTSYVTDENGDTIYVNINTTTFTNPVNLPADAVSLMDFEQQFEVKENKVTEIMLQIDPFRSLQRFKDSYLFIRQVRVTGVKYY